MTSKRHCTELTFVCTPENDSNNIYIYISVYVYVFIYIHIRIQHIYTVYTHIYIHTLVLSVLPSRAGHLRYFQFKRLFSIQKHKCPALKIAFF